MIARRAGFDVPPDTRVLVVRLERVGRDVEPLSIEKLSPVLDGTPRVDTYDTIFTTIPNVVQA